MRINGVLTSSLVNGDGIRYVIFLQGCTHGCVGCQNTDTWAINGGREMSVEEIIDDILKRPLIDGITLSGGEPFMQQAECVKLIKKLPKRLANVWIYTGFTYDTIKNSELANLADFIVDGKFEIDKRVAGWYGGSSNQRLINVKKGTIMEYGERLQPEL